MKIASSKPGSIKIGRILWFATAFSAQLEQLLGHIKEFQVLLLTHVSDLLARLADEPNCVVVATLPLTGTTCSNLLQSIRDGHPELPVIFHDPGNELRDPAELLREGAFYCLTGELLPDVARRTIQAAFESRASMQMAALASRTVEEPWRGMLIGDSPEMQRVVEIVRLIAARRSTVLVTGETGTGKEVVARAIHAASDRSAHPFVAVNCSARPETLLEARPFGHAKGAFTGAVSQRIGRFEQAHRGAIFLDEIGDLPLETQGKLLRVLQEREFERIGSGQAIQVDTRVIAATNVNLAEAVGRKTFREDLYYRLKVVPIHLPPLRERAGDIPLLVPHFVAKICRKENMPEKYVTVAALDHLAQYHWPGNVRQLEHAVETAIVLSGARLMLEPPDFPLGEPAASRREPVFHIPQEGLDFEELIAGIQRHLLQHALDQAGGNKSRAAGILRMKRSTLVSKVKALG